MKKDNSRLWLWAVIVVIVIIVIILFVSGNKQETSQPTIVNQLTTTKPAQNNQNNTSVKNTKVTTATLSYNEALKEYADRRIQLDPTCQAHPNNVTYKGNTSIMIDNRSSQTRTVKVDTTFTIGPWGFKIVVLPNVNSSSKNIMVDCDQSRNVATILVQK